jgi:hypothetical protein
LPIKLDWNTTKLVDYLLFDYWRPYPAWRVLVGLDYYAEKNRVSYPMGMYPWEPPFNDTVLEAEVLKMENEIDRLREFWFRAGLEDEEYPPSFFIEWALSKRVRPSWLDWAIEEKLYIPTQEIPKRPGTVSQESEITGRTSKWRKAFEYESEGLNALYDLIERYFFDENGKPIYDPQRWPIKKSLEVQDWNWSPRTLDEADTIITSGKRKGKAAK